MAKKHSLDARASNYFGHSAQNLKSRENLIKRGVKPSTPNLPVADYTFDGMMKTIKTSDKRTTARRK